MGGLITAAVVGIGGYLLYQYFQNQATTSQTTQLGAGQATAASSTLSPSQVGVLAAQNQVAFQGAQGATSVPTTGTTNVSQ